ncbi:MAG TPA: DUF4386 domain-containing protein [Anaerolineales bacterium]|nr:DUF4386 domain-containing protein [Anaerolineales bacterium]HNC07757.1 DUF4386 domain-containing protein [Anaerolineales bacterium]HND46985.1 DUF4386 domain-containing protein [Anaerolineales bacterium]
MKTYRKTAMLVGSAYLFSNITFILGAIVIVEAILGSPDYLSLISASRAQLALGVLLSFANGLAYVGIAVLLFPILKPRFESLALAYVGFRVVEFITQILADVSPLALLTLAGDTNQAVTAQGLGALLLTERFWAFQMLNLIFSLSAVLLYAMLLRSRLIPGFISIWGLFAATLVLFNTVLGWFNPELGETLGMVTGLPMLLNEVFLGLWLIFRGFNPSATIIEPARQFALEV